jgi:hypothetical protein
LASASAAGYCAKEEAKPMTERRRRRSTNRVKALKLLLDGVRARSEVSSIAVVDAEGFVIAGSGDAGGLGVLGFVSERVARGAVDAECVELTRGTDVVACPLAAGDRRLYLGALGSRVRRMPEAARAVLRILAS